MYQKRLSQYLLASFFLGAVDLIIAFTSIPLFNTHHKNSKTVSKKTHEWNTLIIEGKQKNKEIHKRHNKKTKTSLNFFGNIFEESGPLGKGITVGKVQVMGETNQRSSDTSIFTTLEDEAKYSGNTNEELAEMARDVCISLLRKTDEWRGACSDSKWFSGDDSGKAESLFNDWCTREASKFDKEYIPKSGDEEIKDSTHVVVSLIIEIQGDQTKFDGAGYSISKTKDILSSIASDAMVDDGYCVNAVEVYWTPSARNEVLTKNDVIIDFPELIDM